MEATEKSREYPTKKPGDSGCTQLARVTGVMANTLHILLRIELGVPWSHGWCTGHQIPHVWLDVHAQ